MLDRRVAVAHLVHGHREHALAGLQHPLRLGEPPHERDPDDARTGLGPEAHPHVGVGEEHVLFPLGVAEQVAAVAGRGLHALGLLAAEDEGADELAVQPHLELVARAHAADVVHVVAVQADLQVVLAVDGEDVADGDAPARPERQVVAHAVVLQQQDGDLVGLRGRPQGGLAERRPPDLAGGRQVALHEGGRDGQHVGVVVEAVLVEVVGRQQVVDVHVHRQQVAHRVGVLGAVQAVHGLGASGVGRAQGDAVDLRFQPPRDPVVDLGVGPRTAHRGHGAGAQLRDHLLPQLGVAGDVGEVVAGEAQARGAQPVVVAGQAVPVDGGPEQVGPGGRVGGRTGLGGRTGREDRQDQQHGRGRSEAEPLRNSLHRGSASLCAAWNPPRPVRPRRRHAGHHGAGDGRWRDRTSQSRKNGPCAPVDVTVERRLGHESRR